MSGTDDEARWRAVQDREPSADGTFVYAVRTTGIYCRPTCPSRRPRRDRVSFFDAAPMAAAAGFRACERCDPDGPTRAQRDAELVVAACLAIERAERPPTLAELAAAVGVSRDVLHRRFVAATGLTPKAWAAQRRAQRADVALASGRPVLDAGFDSGYGSASSLYADADARLGMTPGRRRRGGDGALVRWATASCSLGRVLVAATDTGICAVALGDEDDELVDELRRRLPAAQLVADAVALGATLDAVVELVEDPRRDVALPLDIRGTAFQVRVWQALRRVAVGSTTTYAALAGDIGAPGSARAVAGACAANPLAVVVPCHRVLRSDGSLSGYRWGPARKRALLDREASTTVDSDPTPGSGAPATT